MTSPYFYGIGEPFIQREQDTGVPAEAYLDLAAGLGCTAIRNWMHLTEILEDPLTPHTETVEAHKRLLAHAKELGMEVTGMSHEWFLPEGCRSPRRGHAIPRRDLTEGSLYRQTLDLLEQSWYTMVSLFPEVPLWEVGNNFRLLEETGMLQKANAEQNSIGGLTEVYFGMFTEPESGCQPRKKAWVLQQHAGGTADLLSLGREVAAKARHR